MAARGRSTPRLRRRGSAPASPTAAPSTRRPARGPSPRWRRPASVRAGRAPGGSGRARPLPSAAPAAVDLWLICYDARRVQGHVLGRAALQALVGRVAALPPAALAALAGLDPGRAAILPAGAVILERVVEAARASAVTVSDHGV